MRIMRDKILKLKYLNIFLITIIVLLLIAAFSCNQKDKYAGKYAEQGEQLQKTSEIELKDNGQGVWRVLNDEISFSWSISDNEIRLHTKSGGIIIGRIKDDILEILLPGSKIKYFKRVK